MKDQAVSNEPALISNPTQVGGVADEIMKDAPPPTPPMATPGTVDGKEGIAEADKALTDNINKTLDNSPEGQVPPAENKGDGNEASESTDEGYSPAQEFTDFLQSQNSGETDRESDGYDQGVTTPATNGDGQTVAVLRDIIRNNPELASSIREQAAAKGINLDVALDSQADQRLAGMESTIKELASMINNDRDTVISQSEHDAVNQMYLDVIKDVPDYAKPLTNIFNNAFLRDTDAPEIDRKSIEAPNKAIQSELDNYFDARAKAEGWVKSNAPINSNPATITPPNLTPQENQQKLENRPLHAFEEADRAFEQQVHNLLR